MDAATEASVDDMQRWAYTEFFEQHCTALERLAFLVLRDTADAQDVAQEVLEDLYRRWDTLRPNTVAAYARTCVVNRSRNVLRRRAVARRFAPWLVADPVAPDVAPPDRALWQAVCALPRRQREVVVLKYWCDLPDDEIARVLGVGVGTVKSSAHRARQALGAVIEGQQAAEQAVSKERGEH